MISLWLFVSTVCLSVENGAITTCMQPNQHDNVIMEKCVQQIRISTSPDLHWYEERHFICDFVGHKFDFTNNIVGWKDGDIEYRYTRCTWCRKKRQQQRPWREDFYRTYTFVQEEKTWVEEP